MSTIIEIERAIESLPTAQMIELSDWFVTQHSSIAASEAIFQMLDEEEGSLGWVSNFNDITSSSQ